jgi:TRAP-type C4-dicarboxylate transport system permease small subunit
LRFLYKTIDWLTDLGATLATVSLGILVGSLWIEVVARYFFNAPTIWAQSASLYCVLASVMLMLPYITREGVHVGMSLIYEVLPGWLVRPVASGLSLLSFLVCVAATWICGVETLRQYDEHVLTTDALFLPKWWISAFLVWGFALSALQFARQTVSGEVPSGMGG